MKDLYRNKDKLLQPMDKAVVLSCRQTLVLLQTIGTTRSSSFPSTGRRMHSCPRSNSETFWWPTFRKMMIGLIDGGLIPMPLWEADCTKRLEVIRDIPAGKCIYWFERTDMVKCVRSIRGCGGLERKSFAIPADHRQAEEVDAAVRHLADNVFHKGGKLILDAAFGIPDETPVENVRAMYAAARKYAS